MKRDNLFYVWIALYGLSMVFSAVLLAALFTEVRS